MVFGPIRKAWGGGGGGGGLLVSGPIRKAGGGGGGGGAVGLWSNTGAYPECAEKLARAIFGNHAHS